MWNGCILNNRDNGGVVAVCVNGSDIHHNEFRCGACNILRCPCRSFSDQTLNSTTLYQTYVGGGDKSSQPHRWTRAATTASTMARPRSCCCCRRYRGCSSYMPTTRRQTQTGWSCDSTAGVVDCVIESASHVVTSAILLRTSGQWGRLRRTKPGCEYSKKRNFQVKDVCMSSTLTTLWGRGSVPAIGL